MFFLPYRDDNPTRSFPLVNWLFISTNLWVFFTLQLPLGPNEQMAYFSNFGFIPNPGLILLISLDLILSPFLSELT